MLASCLLSSRWQVLLLLFWCWNSGSVDFTQDPEDSSVTSIVQARFRTTPLHGLEDTKIYLANTHHGETKVTHASSGSDFRPDDYVTHADGMKLLTGGIDGFLSSDLKQAIVPVVDDEDVKNGGSRLLGFVMIQTVTPRKISTRTGEIAFDFEEGGPAPSVQVGELVIGQGGVQSVKDEDYTPPPHGGGQCITARDCFYHNGTCPAGYCECQGDYTGSYCQLYRPGKKSISNLSKDMRQKTGSNQKAKTGPAQDVIDRNHKETIVDRNLADSDHGVHNTNDKNNDDETKAVKVKAKPKVKTKVKAKAKATETKDTAAPADGVKEDIEVGPDVKQSIQELPKTPPAPKKRDLSPADKVQEELERLYGSEGVFPEPYMAGKIPRELTAPRASKRANEERDVYAVRFRNGPFGIVFDNKRSKETIVEQVVRQSQAELSDIQPGDRLIYIEHYNMTDAAPKVSQRMLSNIPFPMVLVFETPGSAIDVKQSKLESKQRSLNLTIVYPPSLQGIYPIKIANWTPPVNHEPQGGMNQCIVYNIVNFEADPYGCSSAIDSTSYSLPEDIKKIVESGGDVDKDLEFRSPFTTLLMKTSKSYRMPVDIRSMGITKRGVCTFPAKATSLMNGGAAVGIMVNNADGTMELPSGKEDVSNVSTPFGIVRESDGSLIQLVASRSDVYGILSDPQHDGFTPSCSQTKTLIDELADKWPHSVPHIPTDDIMRAPAPVNKIRSRSEDGGRVAVSGENGWAFFDYHQAMFGPDPQIGSYRLQMADPPFGCDPNQYQVRITGTVVAILRGGGCSFGIKMINAQKLGAVAVMIVNTDEKETMRLMALPDEEPLINIPCIMVSRRIQHFLEDRLKYYYPIDQHIVSIHPTGVFGDYEKSSKVVLPTRLPGE